MDEKKIIKPLPQHFKKGNKAAVGHKPKEKHYVTRCKEFMEEEGGWEKLFGWALSRNWKASNAAINTIAAYAYGKPREQIKIDGQVPISIQNWFLSVRNTAVVNPGLLPDFNANGGIPVDGKEQPRLVLPERTGHNGLGKANGNSGEHSGPTSNNGAGVRE